MIKNVVAILQTRTIMNSEAEFAIDLITTSSLTAKPFFGFYIDLDALSDRNIDLIGDAYYSDAESFFARQSACSGTSNNGSIRFRNAESSLFDGTGTIEFWYYKTANSTANSYLFDIDNVNTEISIVELTNGKIYLRAPFGGTMKQTSNKLLQLNVWYHIAITLRDNVYADLYVNGERHGTIGNGVDELTVSETAHTAWRLGYSSNNGYFNNFRVSEIVRYVGAGYDMPTTGFIDDEYAYVLEDLNGPEDVTCLFDSGKSYTFHMDQGVLQVANNNRIQSEEKDLYSFGTPGYTFITKAELNSTNTELTLTYNAEVLFIKSGYIYLYDSDDNLLETIDIEQGNLVGNTITNLPVTAPTYFGDYVYLFADEGIVKGLNWDSVKIDSKVGPYAVDASPNETLESYCTLQAAAVRLKTVDASFNSDVTQELIPSRICDLDDELIVTATLEGEAFVASGLTGNEILITVAAATVEIAPNVRRGLNETLTTIVTCEFIGSALQNATAEITVTATGDFVVNATFDHEADISASSNIDIIGSKLKQADADMSMTASVAITANDVKMIITIDTNYSTNQNFGFELTNFVDTVIDWGDGTVTTNDTSPDHWYQQHGSYKITVSHGTNTTDNWAFRVRDEYYCQLKITSVDYWKDVSANSLSYAFKHCDNLTHLDENFPQTVNNIDWMFYDSDVYRPTGMAEWQLHNVTSMDYIFYNAQLFDLDIRRWDLAATTSTRYMFYNALNFNQPLGDWNTSSVTDMRYMFYAAESFNQDIDSWDVSGVSSFRSMFDGATAFNQPLNSWTLLSIIPSTLSMYEMFKDAAAFNQPLSSWDVSSVDEMYGMFRGATAFNQDLSSWDTSDVGNMAYMFEDAISFDGSVAGWDIARIDYIFKGATAFNQPLISWDTTGHVYMSGIFDGATAFNQDISSWDVSSATQMNYTFRNASSFNQDLSGWDVDNVTNHTDFDTGATAWEEANKPNFT